MVGLFLGGGSPLLLIMMTVQLNDGVILVVLGMHFFYLYYFRCMSSRYHLDHKKDFWYPIIDGDKCCLDSVYIHSDEKDGMSIKYKDWKDRLYYNIL